MDPNNAIEEYNKIVSTLQKLGLSQYEIRAFLALLMLGVGSADVIAKNADIPRTSAYKVLDSLEEKGFVISSKGRPKMYKPEDLEVIRRNIMNEIDELFKKLEFVESIFMEKGEPQLVYTIYGTDKVMKKIAEMIDMAEREIIISTPKISEIRRKLEKNIERAINRGVKIIVVTQPNQRAPPGTQVYRKTGLMATDIVCDNKRALLASPELNACGYTDNPALAQHLTHFINILIEKE
ncbi:putative transcriptional regulator [Aciduliprofundum sp. MAR08-339]|uniref:TrmB family transcriptional regulator n=1 Tax=Aciduliprofundum sp. (strain MAR08-339) TaxID=673860 RepID=UPI0002A4BEA7|nr:putative transcriptional regulator [Aciduliprofundum sp. MAR08-339]